MSNSDEEEETDGEETRIVRLLGRPRLMRQEKKKVIMRVEDCFIVETHLEL